MGRRFYRIANGTTLRRGAALGVGALLTMTGCAREWTAPSPPATFASSPAPDATVRPGRFEAYDVLVLVGGSPEFHFTDDNRAVSQASTYLDFDNDVTALVVVRIFSSTIDAETYAQGRSQRVPNNGTGPDATLQFRARLGACGTATWEITAAPPWLVPRPGITDDLLEATLRDTEQQTLAALSGRVPECP